MDSARGRNGAIVRARNGRARQRAAARVGLESERVHVQRVALGRRRGDGMKLAAMLIALLPIVGTKFATLPEGKGKAVVESRCYACHSADLLMQQRLTEKQWTAAVE